MPIQIAGTTRPDTAGSGPHRRDARRNRQTIGGGGDRTAVIKAVQCGRSRSAPISPSRSSTRPTTTKAFHGGGRADRHHGNASSSSTYHRHGGEWRISPSNSARLESCGKLPVPDPARCAIRGDKRRCSRGRGSRADLTLLERICETMKFGSLYCAAGSSPIGDLRHDPFPARLPRANT